LFMRLGAAGAIDQGTTIGREELDRRRYASGYASIRPARIA